jgi:AmiR/NasT family two-component response regulator
LQALGEPQDRLPEPLVSSRSLRILIGEDESVTALGLEQDLRSLGHTVIGVAGDGATAVSMARTLSPDLIILDVRMPHLSGLEAAEQIHAERPVPIVIVTAYSDTDTIAKAANVPVFHYLVKPVSAASSAPPSPSRRRAIRNGRRSARRATSFASASTTAK